MKQLGDGLLEMQVQGVNLRAGVFADQLGARPTLIVFLRHFG